MVGTNSSKLDDLFELGEVLSKGLGGKAAAIICDKGLRYNTMIPTELFILFVQSRCRVKGLFAILTSCTPGYFKELAGCSVKASGFLCVGKYTRSKEELHFLHPTMTKSVEPLQQSFRRRCVIHVGNMNLRNSGVKC